MVRHGDVYNPRNIVYGRLPRFRLSDIGKRQASELAQFLAGKNVSELYSSPQLRARQTAAILNEAVGCKRIRLSRLISEVRTGYEGEPNSILQGKDGKFNFYDELARSDDETIAMIARRMTQFLHLMHRRHPGERVIGVSHADPIMILRAAVLGLPLLIDSLRGPCYPAKCSVMEFRFEGDSLTPKVEYHTPVRDETAPSDDKRDDAGLEGPDERVSAS